MTECTQRENVSTYVLRALPDDEYERFVTHLDGCEE